MQKNAVIVKDAYKRYGKKQPLILDSLNMTVPRGCIYGLLGASGCGKTTLLSCIVGVRKLDQGEIWVLGGKPGQKDSGIPGPRVGYMPQEISLVGEFSVIGALYYFGRINGLEDSDIDERFPFFSKLLQLPPKDQLVKYLSGGQQRRVSFAASLMHNPELLILDEPTVGLDSVLRDDIWQFLVNLTEKEGISVIITTHYIEETKLASKIGILRCGQLLAEMGPKKLLIRCNCQSLQEAFLILSQKQEEHKDKVILNVDDDKLANEDVEELSNHKASTPQPDHRNNYTMSERQLPYNQYNEKKRSADCLPSFKKIFRALIIKNLLQVLRHPGVILVAFIFPIIQTTLFFYAVGADPKGIIVAVVNDEAGHCDHGRNLGQVIYNSNDKTCDYIDISCRFLHGFNESFMIKQYFNTLGQATLAVDSGKAQGTMYFGRNFSQAFQIRRDTSIDSLEDDNIIASEIYTRLGINDVQIGGFLKKNIYKRFFEIHADIVSICDIPRKFASMPIYFEEPVFGSKDQKFSDFIAPGFILSITFFLATAVSSSVIIEDRAEGVWDRSLVQGVTTSFILFSHILTQFLIMFIQVIMVLIITFAYFQLSCRGHFGMTITLIMLNATGGLCFGFLISVLCNSHTLAHLAAIATFYSLVLLGGVIWPLEGLPSFLRYISYIMPTTIPTLALRGLMDKGHTIFDLEVYSGFFVTIGWIAFLVTLCLLGLRKNETWELIINFFNSIKKK